MTKEKPKSQSGAKVPADAADTPAKSKPRGKSRVLLFTAVFLMLAAVGGGGGWFYLHEAKASASADKPAAKKTAPPAFVNLDVFTVNLADRERYLQLGITYEVAAPETSDSMKLHMPILRSRILLLLAAKTAEDLGSPEGKSRLAAELVDRARETLPLASDDKGVAAVHFAAFVIQ